MKIEIKELENNYNISKQSDLKVFFKFLSIFWWLIISLFFLLLLIANLAVNFISLEEEKKLFWSMSSFGFEVDEEKTNNLKELLWNKFIYDIFVVKSDESNAFTLPWWTILVTDSLVSEIKYENSLLFIIWHEIWHIENRDVFKRMVSETPLRIILSIIWIWWDLDLWFILDWTSSFYWKQVELDSDKKWLEFLYEIKNDVSCATYFFENRSWFWEELNSFLSDHPMNSSRIIKINNMIKEKWYKQKANCDILKL